MMPLTWRGLITRPRGRGKLVSRLAGRAATAYLPRAMKPGKNKVGLVQTTVDDDKVKPVQKTLERVREAAARGAKLICLQELFASQYFCQVEDAALFDLA